jgi:hypothetical protein
MRLNQLRALAFLASSLFACPLFAEPAIQRSAYHDDRVVTVVEALEPPWSMAFIPEATCS